MLGGTPQPEKVGLPNNLIIPGLLAYGGRIWYSLCIFVIRNDTLLGFSGQDRSISLDRIGEHISEPNHSREQSDAQLGVGTAGPGYPAICRRNGGGRVVVNMPAWTTVSTTSMIDGPIDAELYEWPKRLATYGEFMPKTAPKGDIEERIFLTKLVRVRCER